jgi:aminoglycoside phosphotransferase
MSARPAWLSLVELLHPDGAVECARVIGGGATDDTARGASTRADLVVLTPSREEAARAGWLRNAVREASELTGEGGMVYAVSGRKWRGRLRRYLAERGFAVEATYLHHPGWPAAGLLVPVTYGGIAYAYSRLIHTDPLRRRAAFAALRAPGALAAARRFLPQVGLVARRPGGRASLGWLRGGSGGAGTVVQASWRGPEGAVLLHALDGGAQAEAIAKLWLRDAGREAHRREQDGLRLATETAGSAGARVPRLLREGSLRGRPYLVEEAVAGEKAAAILGRAPDLLPEVLNALAGWLGEWHRRTAQPREMGEGDVERHLLGPARALREMEGPGGAHEAHLRRLGERVRGRPFPFVATHGDLTMVNVLLDGGDAPGIIDWETAEPAGLPMADFFYAAVDAVAAASGYADRLAAWEACFGPDGAARPAIARWERGLAAALGLDADQIAFAFHATWLRYALAERQERAKAVPDEFLRIAQRAAQTLMTGPQPRTRG